MKKISLITPLYTHGGYKNVMVRKEASLLKMYLGFSVFFKKLDYTGGFPAPLR